MASEYSSTTEFLQKTVDQALNAANNNASRIYSLPPRGSLREPSFSVKLTDPNLEPPPDFSDLIGADNADATVDWLNEQADEWMAKYFPAIFECFKTMPEEVLCDIMSGVKPFGVDKTVFEMVWHNARDRAYRTVNSEVDTLAATFSNRGFALPPGAMVDLVAQAERTGRDSILDVNRDQAVKDADIKVDLLKHALSLATQLKVGLLNTMADFYRMWATLPDKDIERARVRAQAMSAFYQALSAYYNVELGFQELTLKAATADAEVDLGVDKNRVAQESNAGPIANALGQATSAFAQIAAQASVAGGSLTAQIESL